MNRIVVRLSSTSNFRLTGINYIQYRPNVTHFPKDVSLARIGYQGWKPRLEEDPAFVELRPANISQEPPEFNGEPVGYIIHAHCWALLNQTSGATFGQVQLQKFIRAAQNYWRGNRSRGSINDGHSYLPTRGVWGSNDWHIWHSPLIIPEIQTAIKRAQNIKPSGTYFDLPLELQMMIIEVAHPQDIRNMLLAFGWILPESFWKSHFSIDGHLFFELNPLKKTNSARWQTIYLELASVLQDKDKFWSSGLGNRQRVLKIIDSILGDMQEVSPRA